MLKILVRQYPKPKTQTLEAFCAEHGLTVCVRERDPKRVDLMRYYAEFPELVEEVAGSLLYSVYGNGNNPMEALNDLCSRLSNTRLKIKNACYVDSDKIVPGALDLEYV